MWTFWGWNPSALRYNALADTLPSPDCKYMGYSLLSRLDLRSYYLSLCLLHTNWKITALNTEYRNPERGTKL